MSTTEVTRNEWSSFFETFSKQHEGWLATLEVFGDEVGAQTEAVELPFEGISLNSDEEPESVVINLGGTPDDHISHMIEHPRQVWLRQTAEGTNQAIEIEEEDHQKTLLRFRSDAG
jgi:hypothetical protein